MVYPPFNASSEVHLRSSRSPIDDAAKPRLLTIMSTTAAFDPSGLWLLETSSGNAVSRAYPHLNLQNDARAPSDTMKGGRFRPEGKE